MPTFDLSNKTSCFNLFVKTCPLVSALPLKIKHKVSMTEKLYKCHLNNTCKSRKKRT